MRFPFTKRPNIVVNNMVSDAEMRSKIEVQSHTIQILEARLDDAERRAAAARDFDAQLVTPTDQSPRGRIESLVETERKMFAVCRYLSGEEVALEAALLKQLGNRLGLSSPTIDKVFARCDALQRVAVTLDQINQRLGSIFIEDVEFEHAEDLEALTEAQNLAGRG